MASSASRRSRQTEKTGSRTGDTSTTSKIPYTFTQYSSCCAGLAVGAVFHPFSYVKTLIQLGHEPLPLSRGKAYFIFGADTYYLPNVFKYMKHIKKSDGFTGLYTGVFSSVGSNCVGLGVSMVAMNYLNETYPDDVVTEAALRNETTGRAYSRFVKKMTKETASKALGIIASRPIQVVLIRRFAQFVGKETIYVSTLGSLRLIYREEGVKGLFSGLVPQLVGEMLIFWISSTLLFAFDRYWKSYITNENENEDEGEEEEEEDENSDYLSVKNANNMWKKVAHFAIPYLVNSFFYPFALVSTCMAVNGSPLKIGQQPFTPIFLHWQDCWSYLGRERQLKRGSKLMFRSYEGPIDYRAGDIYVKGPKKYQFD